MEPVVPDRFGTSEHPSPEVPWRESATMFHHARQRPLLIMFYPMRATITKADVAELHALMGRYRFNWQCQMAEIDVLLHTFGGDPVASYHLARIIRDCAVKATFIVPEHAYSAGTLLCLAGDDVLLGTQAVLSPIDITIVRHRQPRERTEEPTFDSETRASTDEVELVAIDHFIKAAAHARVEIEREFRRSGWTEAKSDAESAMLKAMVDELGVIQIGKIYRERNITQAYAKHLLNSYMLRGSDSSIIERATNRLVADSPSHSFDLDYHLCNDIGLRVYRMEESLSDQCKQIVKGLRKEEVTRSIDTSAPFFELIGVDAQQTGSSNHDSLNEHPEENASDDQHGKQIAGS